ncbi:MAG: DUF1385 domain-containing protein [Clostridia bacterium]|nr:DUF1385 domain-containing protein [Clostridia bacterium]
MAKKRLSNELSCRLNKVGGQAVLEGVMMKAGERTVTTCRKADGSLVVTDDSFKSIRKKYKILNIPVIRGVVNFIEMMILSFKTLGASADALGLEEEEPSKFEKWLAKRLGVGITDFIMVVSLILGLGLSVLLFVLLPGWISYAIDWVLSLFGLSLGVLSAVVEGVVKVGIFIAYLSLVSLMPDIKRTFMYHGAEHKSIACFEAGDELTPENAAKHKRFHPRCGTSFMFFMILLGIFAGLIIKQLIPGLSVWAYSGIRILILPLLMGIGYEVIMLAGKHDNIVTRVISTPGLWVQRITTKEPTPDMLEVAITSIKCALRDEFPEFLKFYEDRAWEPEKPEGEEADTLLEETEDSNIEAYEEQTEEPEENTSKAEAADSPAAPIVSEDEAPKEKPRKEKKPREKKGKAPRKKKPAPGVATVKSKRKIRFGSAKLRKDTCMRINLSDGSVDISRRGNYL